MGLGFPAIGLGLPFGFLLCLGLARILSRALLSSMAPFRTCYCFTSDLIPGSAGQTLLSSLSSNFLKV